MSGWLWLVVGYALGTLISGIIYLITVDKYYVGNLREDRSIPEEPYYFMEIAGGRFDRLAKNKFALLRVTHQNYIQEKKDDV